MSSKSEPPFWQSKSLEQMTHQEWESLCDGCGHCCLVKLQDEESEQLYVTNVACRLLDLETCRCRDYEHRSQQVADCLLLSHEQPDLFNMLPETCAYRCLYEGRSLPDWHPLLTHNKNAVHELGISVKAYAISEEYIHPEQMEAHIIGRMD